MDPAFCRTDSHVSACPQFFARQTPSHVDRSQLILQWALRIYDQDILLASSLGPQSLVILDLLSRMDCSVRTVFLDTGLLFEETLQLKDRVERHFGMRIESVTPELSVEAMAQAEGPRLWDRDPDRCCALRKTAPLRGALQGAGAWITGIRRSHSPTRAQAMPVEWDEQSGLVKVNPLVAWSREQVMEYLEENRVPFNPLLKDGYPSIGCRPCTSQVAPGGDERAGRWKGSVKTECGLHGGTTKR